ncbi:hypothetical protein EV426DRAFT_417210 [Tirmania nivea]|nr:hypothetical protein EV426DRAFT_417210 [Tirmania nivea]
MTLFRMQRRSFWLLVDVVTPIWPRKTGRKRTRPIYHQLAVGLYMLGSAGPGLEGARIGFNRGKGSVVKYLWRSIAVLSKIIQRYIRWPGSLPQLKISLVGFAGYVGCAGCVGCAGYVGLGGLERFVASENKWSCDVGYISEFCGVWIMR